MGTTDRCWQTEASESTKVEHGAQWTELDEEEGCACRIGDSRLEADRLMALRRRLKRGTGPDLVVIQQPGGVLVAGKPGAVESAVDRLVEIVGMDARPASATAADLAALVATGGAWATTHGQYLRLTARSMELLEQHGLVPTDRGSFWGFVRDSGRISGVLDFEKVNLAPQQMMALQTAAVSLALRAAIKEVQAAVERVGDKVDDVLGLLQADRVGDILGIRRLLEPRLERVRCDGRISTTDWSAVAALGADIATDIEALRAHIRSKLKAADGGWRPGERAKDAERLFDEKGLLTESVALLVVAENSLGAWHELRIAHVRANEPDHLAWTIEDAQSSMAAENEDDQSIADDLRAAFDQLTTPRAHDGLAPWQREELVEARSRLGELAGWFADQRMLDLVPLGEVPYPTAKESLRHLSDSVSDLAGRSFDVVRDTLGRGNDGHDTPELPPPDQAGS